MPHSSDDPPSAPTASVESEAPSATAQDTSTDVDPSIPSSQGDEPRQPRRRRRRRHRRPSLMAGLQDAPVAGESRTEEAPVAGDTGADAHIDEQAPKPARRRRRRRRGPARDAAASQLPPTGDAPIDGGDPLDSTAVAPGEGSPQRQPSPNLPGEPRPRHRGRRRPPRATFGPTDPSGQSSNGSEPGQVSRPGPPRYRRPRDAAARQGEPPRGHSPRQPREGATPARDASERDRGRRGRGFGTRDRRDRGPGGRPSGRGRETARKKPEQKLYALESVVDRGFEDVTDDSDEGATRRIHWTIVKRTVADQKSGKPMSAVYVLQREGVEAEFPNLGAARTAVNKTIVHPEKLTLSKAEHVAAKGNR
jgi:hypothetical protein